MFSRPHRRNLLRTLSIAAALVVALVSASIGSAADSSKPSPPNRPSLPVKADRDGDKLFDDLEARLATMGPHDELSVLVRLTAPASKARVDELSRRVGGFTTTHRFDVVDGLAARVNKGQAEALTHVPWVVHVEENSAVHKLNDTAQSSFGVTKARADAPGLDGNADGNAAAYSRGDLVAAVIDTGIDASHLDLDEGKVIAFKDFVNGRTSAYDDEGHGTHVAATIAGDGDARPDRLHKGVAPDAALVGVKVLDATGGGSMANVTAAIDWVVQNKDVYGIEAINLSLGASGCANGTDLTSTAANNAHAAGLVVAVAAGNEGPGTCTVGSPGAAANAVTVGAMADLGAGGFSLASFSSRGKTADGRLKPDVAAPGANITSAQANTTSGYISYNGTSMATPFTAGVALLMRDANSALTPQQVKDKLTTTALDWGRVGADGEYGAGRLDAYAALTSAGAPLTAAPAMPRHVLYEGTLSATGAYVDYPLDVGNTSSPIAATLIIPAISGAYAYSPDFDLYLYNPSGSQVALAESVYRQENVTFQPTATGRYTLRVRSYSGSGAYYVDVSAGIAADTTAPTISTVSPADTATGVAVSTNVSTTFSEPMDTTTQSAFSLVRANDGAAVSGTFAWSGNTMTFDPTADLVAGTQYRATVTTAAKDKAGNALQPSRTWTFTTVATLLTTVSVNASGATLMNGGYVSGSVSSLHVDDENFLRVSSTTSSTYVSSWYARYTGVSNALKSLKVSYRGLGSRSTTQTVYLYRWTDGTWVKIDERTLGTTETGVELTPGGTLADYVSGSTGDGEVRVRVRNTSSAGTFTTSTDLLKLAYTK